MALIPFPGSNAARAQDDDPEDELESEDGGGKMSFLEHLDELRQRLIVSIIAVVVGFLIAFLFIDHIFAFVMRPLQEILPSGGRLIYTEATEAFMLQLKMAALAGVVLAAPVIMWQLWLFIAPGLYSREKRFALPFVLFSSVFFVGGVAFSHYVVFPAAWKFFASFNNDYLEFMPKVSEAFGLYAYMLLAFGINFQMPSNPPPKVGDVISKDVRIHVADADGLVQDAQTVLEIHIVSADPDDNKPPVCRVKPWLPQCQV